MIRNAGGSDTLCPTQESKLAVLWTVGIFALNFGPVFVGPILDWVGPKLTTVLGESLDPECTHLQTGAIISAWPLVNCSFACCCVIPDHAAAMSAAA